MIGSSESLLNQVGFISAINQPNQGFCGSMTQECFSRVPWTDSLTLPRLSLLRGKCEPLNPKLHISTWIVGIRTIPTKKEWQIPSPSKKHAAYRPYNLTNPRHRQNYSTSLHFPRDTPTTQLGSRVPRPCLKPLRSVSDCRN